MTWWNVASVPASIAAGGISNFTLAQGSVTAFPLLLRAGFTCLRMILDVHIRQNAINLNIDGAFAVYVGDENGAGGVDPLIDFFDYYLHQNFAQRDDEVNYKDYHYDIRTARRVRGETRALEFNLTNSSGSASALTFSVSARLLLTPS